VLISGSSPPSSRSELSRGWMWRPDVAGRPESSPSRRISFFCSSLVRPSWARKKTTPRCEMVMARSRSSSSELGALSQSTSLASGNSRPMTGVTSKDRCGSRTPDNWSGLRPTRVVSCVVSGTTADGAIVSCCFCCRGDSGGSGAAQSSVVQLNRIGYRAGIDEHLYSCRYPQCPHLSRECTTPSDHRPPQPRIFNHGIPNQLR